MTIWPGALCIRRDGMEPGALSKLCPRTAPYITRSPWLKWLECSSRPPFRNVNKCAYVICAHVCIV